MFLLTLVITAFAAVTAQDILGVSYHYNMDFLHSFTQKNCGNTTPWDLVSYGHLGIPSPFKTSSMAIRSSRNSCTSSFPIVFFNGTLEVTVYLRTISKNSGIRISVFDEDDNLIVAVKYQRRNKYSSTGWTEISVPITKHARGYVQLSGQSLSSEFVIIDSLRYTPCNMTNVIEDKDKQASPVALTRLFEDTNEEEAFIFQFDETGSGGGEDIEGSGGSVETESPDVDNPDQTSTDEPESAEVIEPEEPGFWNGFTITLVSVGGFVVVGSVGVGMYYLGKNAAMGQSPPLDLEAPEAPSGIIPRVRSMNSDRFSRFS